MKNLLFISFLIVSITAFSQKNTQNKIDPKLNGIWKGNETGSQGDGISKYWVMNRLPDGTFTLIFTAVQNCQVSSHVERGQWWVKEEKYYELHFDSGDTDVYTYNFPTDKKVTYKMVQSQYTTDYEFTDTKIGEVEKE